MRQFIESLKRLFASGAIDRDFVEGLRQQERISAEEKRYILNEV